ncbi:Serine/threonine-protein kinase [Arachnomyces sp. PD_36]|nr:Serine/threonine-protein kinase [Arachnomyces sp. PD_36]
MGQGYSLTSLSAGSAGIDVPELADLVYEKSLGTARFMKSIRARQQNGLVFVKVIMKPYPSMKLQPYVKAILREQNILEGIPNALGYQRVLETETSGYLVRQFIHRSLYDRMSTRPFLEDIEKKWIAFQLLCALRDCHSRDLFHGDIKTENILVTSWNWLYLTDFSSSFKPIFLPEDNPADFSFYFDTSGRRTCYLAPERFLVADEEPGSRGVNWAMDIFSAGCVIAELFLESPIFTLSQLYKYRKGEYSPEHSHLMKIEDKEMRDMILHMIQIDPESRYSADEYLNFWRRKVFPEYFYSFLHQYMELITDPTSGRGHVEIDPENTTEADDRIDRVHLDFDKVSYFLGANVKNTKDGSKLASPQLQKSALPVQLDLPNYRHQTSTSESPVDDGALVFLTLIVSSLPNTAKASARIKACDVLLGFAERIPDEAKLDRILPFVTMLLNDRSDQVKVAAIRTLTQLLAMVQVVTPVNAYVFPEYIFPRLQPFLPGSNSNPSPVVRAAYASCIASLAQSSLRVLDMIQALRSDVRLPTLVPAGSEIGWTEGVTYHNLYDVARVDLLDYFEVHTKALLVDNDPSVRRAFLGSVSSLCVFFGSPKANEVVLSHLNTYLNDKDWILKCAFFETVVGVAAYVGSTSLEEFILPLMIQSLSETEDFVVEKVFRSLASMAELGLFQRSTTWDLLHLAVRFLIHPSVWIREGAVRFVVTSTKYLTPADKYSIITPLLRPFLKINITEISDDQILDALKRPLPKAVYDMALIWATKVEKGVFWKTAARDTSFNLGGGDRASIAKPGQKTTQPSLSGVPKNEEDEQWLSRLRNLGMSQEDEFKLLSLRSYIWRVATRRTVEGEATVSTALNTVVSISQHEIAPQTVFFDQGQGARQRRTTPKRTRKDLEGKTHTVADALLDASTTIQDDAVARRKHTRSKSQRPRGAETSLTIPPQSALDVLRTDSSQNPSPSSSSPVGGQPESQSSSTPASDVDKADIVSQRRGSEQSGLSTPRGLKPPGVQRKTSAIHLLNSKDTSKAYAETSTTSTNAFGKVDAPFHRDPPRTETAMVPQEQETSKPLYRPAHSYKGNNPMVLRLLSSVFSETFPTDLFDFGPVVNPISANHPIKKASGRDPDKPWRPSGELVAMFGEHSAPINRVVVSPDHAFFITASDDSTVKVWDTTRLEKNLTPRSRQTHRHVPGTKVKAITFVEHTHTFISAATDGSIHAVKIDYHNLNGAIRYGRPKLVREYKLENPNEYAVWLEHFRSETYSTLLIATNLSRVLALDLKTMTVIYTLQNPVHHGTPTTICLDKKHNWLLLGTTHGILDLWDLRFRVRLKAWGLPGGTAIHRLQIHPLKGRGRWVCVTGGCSNGGEITVWDIEKVQCREVYRLNTKNGTEDPSANKNANFTADTSWKSYKAWLVDDDRPEGMLGRFATSTPSMDPALSGAGGSNNGTANNNGNNGVDRNGISALAVALDVPEDGKGNSTKCGFLISAGSDRKIRYWDVSHSDSSMVISGLDNVTDGVAGGKPRYETSRANPSLAITTEWMPAVSGGAVTSGRAAGGSRPGRRDEGGNNRPPRNTVISLQQQQLLKSHLDSILDVAILESPYGMTVSVDRAGMIYVFQ